MNSILEDILIHYGMPRRSGRYPWGSGNDPYQHSGDFLSRVQELKKTGTSETDIAKNMGLTTTQLRTQISLAKDERRSLQVATAKGLREKGYSLNEIADKMGFSNDSSVRSLLNENSERRMNQAKATADIIRKEIKEKGMIDVGTGVERELGVSKEKLNQALYILELEGYTDYNGVSRTEDFYFNLSRPEIIEMEYSPDGSLTEMIEKLVSPADTPTIIRLIKDFILKSYGEKSPDGKRLVKSPELATAFSQTEAYTQLFMELVTDSQKASDFINGVLPTLTPEQKAQIKKTLDEKGVSDSVTI